MFSEPAAALRVLSIQIDQSSLIDQIPNPKLMKTQQQRRNSFTELWRRVFRHRATAHDPWLSLNMRLFNYTDGWSRTFSKADYARSWA
jgi:hypothetical protein